MEPYFNDAVELLKELIATPSPSRHEEKTATIIEEFLREHGVENVQRLHNNIWARNLRFDPSKPTILLNSHHDTVAPNTGYTRDPYAPAVEGDRLYGLGSNDAGASAVSLLATFIHFYRREKMRYNIIIAITGQEENSGPEGLESIVPALGKLDFAIVGEPTQMNLAIAEKGLTVIDCVAHGKAGHAGRNEGENAIYKAIKDIEWLRTYDFPRKSEMFGAVKMTVTIINAGTQHNVVPAECRFTVDVRVTDKYTNEEVVEIIRQHLDSEVIPRSTRLKPSSIDPAHPIVQAGLALGRTTYGSPTTSDQSLLHIPSLKVGPGDSARSHSADEFVCLSEIKEGIELYVKMLDGIL